ASAESSNGDAASQDAAGGSAPLVGSTRSTATAARAGAVQAASGGPAATKGPITVGFMVSDYTKTAAAFGITGPPTDPQGGFKGLVAYFNKRGGFAGRQIKPVYYTLDASSADWNVADQAACSTFTQDNHVEVVVSENWIHETLSACLLNAGVPQIDGSLSPQNDRKGLAKLPNVFLPDAVD